MRILEITAQPNQEFDTDQNGTSWTIRLYVNSIGAILADFSKNGEAVLSGVVCQAGFALLPPYLAAQGNFAFITDEQREYPDYKKFGKEHKFVYLEPEEELIYA